MTRILAWNRAAVGAVRLAGPHPAGAALAAVDAAGRPRRATGQPRAAAAPPATWSPASAPSTPSTPASPSTSALSSELKQHSAWFREWWGEHQISDTQRGTKTMEHPTLGPSAPAPRADGADRIARAAADDLRAGRRGHPRGAGETLVPGRVGGGRSRWTGPWSPTASQCWTAAIGSPSSLAWSSRPCPARRARSRRRPCSPRGGRPSWCRGSAGSARSGAAARRARPVTG